MNYQRIEIIEEQNAYKLKLSTNKFISNLKRAPLDVQFRIHQHKTADGISVPRYIAFIRYVDAPAEY